MGKGLAFIALACPCRPVYLKFWSLQFNVDVEMDAYNPFHASPARHVPHGKGPLLHMVSACRNGEALRCMICVHCTVTDAFCACFAWACQVRADGFCSPVQWPAEGGQAAGSALPRERRSAEMQEVIARLKAGQRAGEKTQVQAGVHGSSQRGAHLEHPKP